MAPPAFQTVEYGVAVHPPLHLKTAVPTLGARQDDGCVQSCAAIQVPLFSGSVVKAHPAVATGDGLRRGPDGSPEGPMGNGSEVLLQGFNWECSKASAGNSRERGGASWYRVMESKAAAIAEASITAVWLPPPSDSVSIEGYMPRELDCLDSAYGSEAELRSCISALHAVGVKVIADIVINHRCAHEQDSHGAWNEFRGRYVWDASHICSNNKEYRGRGLQKQEEVFEPAPNVDHTNARVRTDIKEWLNWLRLDVGFDGWRFDFVKGYKGKYVEEYVRASQPRLAVGELWDDCAYREGVLEYDQDKHRQRIIDWCDSTSGTAAVFDFTTKGILQEAVQRKEYWRLRDRAGKPPGVVGWWPSRAVTFVENHDTGSTQNHWPFPARHLAQGYAYILTHPGTPTIFYDHLYSDACRHRKFTECLHQRFSCMTGNSGRLTPLGSIIFKLLDVRKRSAVNCRSTVVIREASADVYAAEIDGKVAMKIGPGHWCPQQPGPQQGLRATPSPLPPHVAAPGAWRLAVSGLNFAVWERTSESHLQQPSHESQRQLMTRFSAGSTL